MKMLARLVPVPMNSKDCNRPLKPVPKFRWVLYEPTVNA